MQPTPLGFTQGLHLNAPRTPLVAANRPLPQVQQPVRSSPHNFIHPSQQNLFQSPLQLKCASTGCTASVEAGMKRCEKCRATREMALKRMEGVEKKRDEENKIPVLQKSKFGRIPFKRARFILQRSEPTADQNTSSGLYMKDSDDEDESARGTSNTQGKRCTTSGCLGNAPFGSKRCHQCRQARRLEKQQTNIEPAKKFSSSPMQSVADIAGVIDRDDVEDPGCSSLGSEQRACSKCKRLISTSLKYLLCESCREKKRAEKARKKMREREKLELLSQSHEERALKKAKTQQAEDKDNDNDDGIIEYQNMDALLAAIAKSDSRRLDFEGKFSIIKEFTVNIEQRINIVAIALQDTPAKLAFSRGNVRVIDNIKTEQMKCKCRSMTSVERATAEPRPYERVCWGVVEISVQRDMSHPLGIVGQKICLRVIPLLFWTCYSVRLQYARNLHTKRRLCANLLDASSKVTCDMTIRVLFIRLEEVSASFTWRLPGDSGRERRRTWTTTCCQSLTISSNTTHSLDYRSSVFGAAKSL